MKRIVCFGCGEIGVKFAERLKEYDEVEIEFFLDNKYAAEEFMGYKRYVPTKNLCKDKYIVITNYAFASEIKAQLESYGLVYDKDFCIGNEFLCTLRRKNYPLVRVGFADFWPGFNERDNFLLEALANYTDVEIDNDNPHILFASVFGEEHKKYYCTKICFTGENRRPDFEQFDYCIGFDRLKDERYLRFPLYEIYNIEAALKKHEKINMDEFLERDFCCRVVSNGRSEIREKVFEVLDQNFGVASGGRFRNNLADGMPVKNKAKFISKYKFNLAFENEAYPGYITEKIVDAWEAGCIPIYWGAEDVGEDFNKKAFIDYRDFQNVEELITFLNNLKEDKQKMLSYLKEPIVRERIDYKKQLCHFMQGIIIPFIDKR